MDPGFITTRHAVRKNLYTLSAVVVALNVFSVVCHYLPCLVARYHSLLSLQEDEGLAMFAFWLPVNQANGHVVHNIVKLSI